LFDPLNILSERTLFSGSTEEETAYQPFGFRACQGSELREFLIPDDRGLFRSALVSRPVPQDVGTVLCYIVREKDSLFRLYTQQGTGRPDRLLLIAREQKRGGKTEFTMATTLAGIKSREPEDGFVGTVQGNVMGTRFGVYDSGVRDDQRGEEPPGERRLLGVTTFQGSAKKLSGDYRRMTVAVPKPVLVILSEAAVSLESLAAVNLESLT
jgi:hypothetical protein